MINSQYSANMNVMVKTVKKASRVLSRDFGEVENLQTSKRGPSEFVTAAEIKAEEFILEELKYARPKFGLMVKNKTIKEGEDPDRRWIVDPLNGSTNFSHGLPNWAISIAIEEKGEIIAAITYAPVNDELFRAEKGNGAYVNSQRLRVAGRAEITDAAIAMSMPSNGRGNHKRFLNQLAPIMSIVATTVSSGCPALDMAYVAAGRVDGYWGELLKPWDVAASSLIIKEAGGFISEIDGGPSPIYGKSTLATNANLRPQLIKILSGS